MFTGVAAEQIIKYLRAHAHPNSRVATKGVGIPPNAADQIMLWALERKRVKSADCVLYCDFPTGTDEFATAVKAASDFGVLLWEDPAGLKLADRLDWPLVDLRIDWAADPVAMLRAAWEVYAPQMEAYVQRAEDPARAPGYGVPGDE